MGSIAQTGSITQGVWVVLFADQVQMHRSMVVFTCEF